MMKHLLDSRQLSKHDITALIQRAKQFKHNPVYPRYPQHTLANLFYENSTRTRVSFELAATRLGLSVVNLDVQHSSESKGEVITDTVKTLSAMGVELFVIRLARESVLQTLAAECGDAHIINAGEGQHAHPSQSLLDLMTIVEHKPDLTRLKIAIVGDLRHSRVANSMQHVCATMGVGELTLVSPEPWQPKEVHYGRTTTSLQDGINDADVVMCLRVQKERLHTDEHIDMTLYRRDYAITSTRIVWAKPDAMVMHPGPINRGVEIDDDVADGAQSYILRQVSNGVFMRMAIIEALILGRLS